MYLVYLGFCASVLIFSTKAAIMTGAIEGIIELLMLDCDINNYIVNNDRNVSLAKLHSYGDQKGTAYIDKAAEFVLERERSKPGRTITIYCTAFAELPFFLSPTVIRDAYLKRPDVSYYLYDTSPYTHINIIPINAYRHAVKHVVPLGRAFGKFLIQLVNEGISIESIHIIGFSISSQMLAVATKYVHNNLGRKLHRITVLDPAGPCFGNAVSEATLNSNDANYVEMYQCNRRMFGVQKVTAAATFFVNGQASISTVCKTPFPGILMSLTSIVCSHLICPAIWSESVLRPSAFVAVACDSDAAWKNGSCANNQKVSAGHGASVDTVGTFYFSTNHFYPFGRGEDGIIADKVAEEQTIPLLYELSNLL